MKVITKSTSILLISNVLAVLGQTTWPTWCGKPYELGSPNVPVGGQFQMPAYSEQTLMRLGCAQTIRPYIEGEEFGSIIVDASLTNLQLVGAKPFSDAFNLPLVVTVSNGNNIVASGSVSVNSSAELEFPLSIFKPQMEPYNLTCTAKTLEGETFVASANLSYLLSPLNSSVVKMDARTGATLVQTTSPNKYQFFYPYMFYTDFQSLVNNISFLDEMKSLGLNAINIYADNTVEPSYNWTQLQIILERMEELDMYLYYSMRYIYMNPPDVKYEVDMIKSYKNLLVWYTGDEPDGTSDPLNATVITRDLIYSLDGYHPVSLVLNCFDYYFSEYAAGGDSVWEDIYSFGITPNYSVSWGTVVNVTYGDCGCDDCTGSMTDISRRLDAFSERLFVLGESRVKSIGGVSQGFGGTQYWNITPSTKEYSASQIVSINHGALSLSSWNWVSATQPNPNITAATYTIGTELLPVITPIITDPTVVRKVLAYETIDAAEWTTATGEKLIMAANMMYTNETLEIPGILPFSTIEQIINNGAEVTVAWDGIITLNMGPVASVAFFVKEW